MPAHRRRPPPAEQVLAALRLCRDRGFVFDAAWEAALRGHALLGIEKLVWPHDTEARQAEREALRATRDEWCAAYEGRDTACARLLRRMLPLMYDADELHQVSDLERIAA